MHHTSGNVTYVPIDDQNGRIELNVQEDTVASPPPPRNILTSSDSGAALVPSSERSKTWCPWVRPMAKRPRTQVERCLLAAVLCIAVLFVLVFVLLTLLIRTVGSRDQQSDVCLTEDCVRTAAQLIDAMDVTVSPCQDFFQYACGSWNRKYVIPEDKSSFNTFEKLHDELQIKLKSLLETAISDSDSSATSQAKILYSSCNNISGIELVGDTPLSFVIDDYGGWPVKQGDAWKGEGWSLESHLGIARGRFNAPFVLDVWVGTDDKNSAGRILQLDQPSLGMPSREYYTDQTQKDAYLHLMVEVAKLLGANSSSVRDEMVAVLDFESRLANLTSPLAERQDTSSLYTKMTIQEFQTLIPQFQWLEYFNAFMPIKLTMDEPVMTTALDYLKKVVVLIKSENKRVIANYLVWRLVLGFLPELPEKYQGLRNEYRRILQGVSREKVRWQKCVEQVNERMGLAVGRMFVRNYFRKESKEVAMEMIDNIREAFLDILKENDWMDEQTKAIAMEKARSINERVGYPDYILHDVELDKVYHGLDFQADEYLDNVLKLEQFDSARNLGKLRQPVNKEKWEQDPAIVNAFYNPNTNDIVIPAGILQPLFYGEHFPKSLNYGGIGVVIGHEITHGFDDKGRQYDAEGNLRDWWNNETAQSFRDRAQCMIDQYSNFTLEPVGLQMDGKITQGENIADNGGLKQSFRAYRKWVERNGEEKSLPGITLTHNQLFFLNYAQIWCGIMRDEEALHKIRTSVHSPGPIRVLGPLSNLKEFSDAYNCPLGSRMNPVTKCAVW